MTAAGISRLNAGYTGVFGKSYFCTVLPRKFKNGTIRAGFWYGSGGAPVFGALHFSENGNHDRKARGSAVDVWREDGLRMMRDEPSFLLRFGLRFLQGLIIGIGGVLPGVSGGVLCVVFGLYKPFMETIAQPRKNLKRYWRTLIPVLCGMAAGFLLLLRAVSSIMEKNSELATCLFAGLILGTLPSLFRTAGRTKRTAGSYIALFSSFILFFVLFLFLKHGVGFSITPIVFWFFFVGAVWGISIVLPGLSSASILLFLGLFQPMLDGAKHFDMAVLLPMALGGAAALIGLSKLFTMLFERHASVMNHLIIGVVIATTLPIIPVRFAGPAAFFVDAALLALGFVLAFLFDWFGRKISLESV